MQYLGGMIGGDPAGGYQQSRRRGQDIATGDAEATGDAAFGRALQQLYSPGPPGAQPMPTVSPGQASPPSGGSMVSGQPPSMSGGPQISADAMPPGPGMSALAGGGLPMGGPPLQAGMPPGSGGPSGAGGPGFGQPGGMPPMGGGSPGIGGSPSFGQPGGGIGWQQAVQAVIRANPGIEQNPRALARAVDHFMPIMNQQSLAQWREMQLQLRGAALDVREETARQQEQGRNRRFELGEEGREGRSVRTEEGRESRSVRTEEGRQRRAELSATTRQEIAGMNNEARKELQSALEVGRQQRAQLSASTRSYIAGLSVQARREIAEQLEAGRNRRADQAEEGREGRFETREARLQSKTDFDREFRSKSLDLAERRFGQTKTKQERDAAYREEKQRLDEAHRRMQEHINATNAGDKTVLKDLEKSYKEAVKRLDDSFMGKKTNTGVGIPVPLEHQSKPDGDKFEVDGKPYVKRGNMLVPQ